MNKRERKRKGAHWTWSTISFHHALLRVYKHSPVHVLHVQVHVHELIMLFFNDFQSAHLYLDYCLSKKHHSPSPLSHTIPALPKQLKIDPK